MELFGGQLVNLSNIPIALRWIQYIAIVPYTNKAFAQNEFTGLTFSCPANATQCVPRTGESILSDFSLNDIPLWTALGINMTLMKVFLIAGYVMFSVTSRPPTKLKTFENEDKFERAAIAHHCEDVRYLNHFFIGNT